MRWDRLVLRWIGVVGLLGSIAHPAQATFGGSTSGVFAYHDVDPLSVEPFCHGCPLQYAIFLSSTGRITDPAVGPPFESDVDPAFSPDGSKIVFARKDAQFADSAIEVMDADGGNRHALVDSDAVTSMLNSWGLQGFSNPQLVDPTWSADGETIAFVVHVGGSAAPEGGIWAIGVDGSGLERLVENGGAAGEQRVFAPEWAPYGTKLAYRCRMRVSNGSLLDDLCTYDTATGLLRLIPIDWPSQSRLTMGAGGPKWTPDGRRLLFNLFFAGFDNFAWSTPTSSGSVTGYQQSEIFSVRPDGSGLQELTHAPPELLLYANPVQPVGSLWLEQPSMSPDGKTILAHGQPLGLGHELYLLDANGGGVRKLRSGQFPDASPFGGLDWQPKEDALTVLVDDGHGHELSGLYLELRTPSGDVVLADPVNRMGGRYAFPLVAPGSYVVRVRLVDDNDPPAFGIFHAPDTSPDRQEAWIERSIEVTAGAPGLKIVHFDDSATVRDSNLPPAQRDRLDDLAFLYFRVRQFVDWVHDNLTTDTGRPVAFEAFSATDQNGAPLGPERAAYAPLEADPTAVIVLGTSKSAYEDRDGIADGGYPDDAPENGEWHEFTHHLYHTFVDPSPCVGVNHDGYANPGTCDSMDEGFAMFLPTLAAQDIEGTTDANYAGFGDLEEGEFKAWSFALGSDGARLYREDLAVASLFWDLVDANLDAESTAIVAANGSHQPALYTDSTSLSLHDLWLALTTLHPSTVRALHEAIGGSAVTVDLDGDGTADVSTLDETFLNFGFFPVDAEQSIAGHTAYHYDVAAAQRANPALPRDDDVGYSDHVQTDAGGIVIGTFIPRSDTPAAPEAGIELHVQDTSGTPLSGATIELAIEDPPPPPPQVPLPRTITRKLGSGDGVRLPLSLRPYFDYLLPDGAPLPPCDPANDVVVNVTVTAKLNGYAAAETPSFDNCSYQHAIAAAASGQTALSFTMTFPEDGTAPSTAIWKQASVAPLGNGTSGFWVAELDCSDPVVGGFASGCDRTEVRVDGGAVTPYDGFVRVDAPGVHRIEYRSIDAAGNAEPFRSQTLGVGVDPDSDGDGLTDGAEIALHTHFEDPDTDDDGLLDGAEVAAGTNPLAPDTDHDGLDDGDEAARGTNPLARDTDGDGLEDGFEVSAIGTDPLAADTDGDDLSDAVEAGGLGTSPVEFDTDGDGRSDGVEFASGTDPLDPDTDNDDDGVPDLTDDCVRIANTAQTDRDGDGIGDACDLFDRYPSWRLVGVTSENGATPESLVAFDLTSAATSFLMVLDNGGSGDAIAFDPADGLLYHASGSGGRVWEAIDLATRTVVASGPSCCNVWGLAYDAATGRFVLSDPGVFQIWEATSDGVGGLLGHMSDGVGPLAFSNGVLYGGSLFANAIDRLSPANGATLGSVRLTMEGEPALVFALATHPGTGEMWGIFLRGDTRYLGTVDLATGVVTAVGEVPDEFFAITFVPEPSRAAEHAAAALVMALCALRDSRNKRAFGAPIRGDLTSSTRAGASAGVA